MTRARILALLPTVASGDTMTAGEVVEAICLSRNAVYQQLSRMVRAGLIDRVAYGSYARRSP